MRKAEIAALLLKALTFCVCVCVCVSVSVCLCVCVCARALALGNRPLAPFRALSELRVPLWGKEEMTHLWPQTSGGTRHMHMSVGSSSSVGGVVKVREEGRISGPQFLRSFC